MGQLHSAYVPSDVSSILSFPSSTSVCSCWKMLHSCFTQTVDKEILICHTSVHKAVRIQISLDTTIWVFRFLSLGSLFKTALKIAECVLCSLYIAELKFMSVWTLHGCINMHITIVCLGFSAHKEEDALNSVDSSWSEGGSACASLSFRFYQRFILSLCFAVAPPLVPLGITRLNTRSREIMSLLK